MVKIKWSNIVGDHRPLSRNWLGSFHSNMITTSNGNIFRVTGPLWGESTSHRWIPLTKASELWCFLWSAPEQTVEQTIERQVIWDVIAPIMTSLWYESTTKPPQLVGTAVFVTVFVTAPCHSAIPEIYISGVSVGWTKKSKLQKINWQWLPRPARVSDILWCDRVTKFEGTESCSVNTIVELTFW